jgi:uncharacterized spore protein YtfJ
MNDQPQASPQTDAAGRIEAALGKVAGEIRATDVFGPPVETAGRVVLAASAIERAGGFGFGSGHSPDGEGGGGGGGGGSATGRPVAAIEISDDGVTVHPIVDPTRIGIAMISALIALAAGRRRRRT